MSVEEEFIDFVTGSLMKGESVDSIVSMLVAGGMAEDDARAAVNNINDQLNSAEFQQIIDAIERELESGRSADDVIADIVQGGVPEEKARPVVQMLAMQVLMKRGVVEAFFGSLINALIIIGERKELEERLRMSGIPDETADAALNGIEALASRFERVGRGENVAMQVMEEFIGILDDMRSGKREKVLDELVDKGLDRKTMESFMNAADYFTSLKENNTRDRDVKEKNETG